MVLGMDVMPPFKVLVFGPVKMFSSEGIPEQSSVERASKG
jgi:hypothetical protein